MRPVERRAVLLAIAEELVSEISCWLVDVPDNEQISPADMADEIEKLLVRQGVDLVEVAP